MCRAIGNYVPWSRLYLDGSWHTLKEFQNECLAILRMPHASFFAAYGF
jgi:hypothetical protein